MFPIFSKYRTVFINVSNIFKIQDSIHLQTAILVHLLLCLFDGFTFLLVFFHCYIVKYVIFYANHAIPFCTSKTPWCFIIAPSLHLCRMCNKEPFIFLTPSCDKVYLIMWKYCLSSILEPERLKINNYKKEHILFRVFHFPFLVSAF